MKKMLACLLAFLYVATGNAQNAAEKASQVQSFKAGGTPIAIPVPTRDMVEVGYDNLEFMEKFVLPTNRLIAAFVLTKDLPRLTKLSDDLVLQKYALVKVNRQGEYMDCSASYFKGVTESVKEEIGDVMPPSMKEGVDEFNRRMKSLDLDEATMSLGKPVQLGCLFSKQDAYGLGMIIPLTMGGDTMKMGMGSALVRVNRRLLFVYLYAEYKNEDSVKWLRNTTEEWADAILKANN